MNIIEFQAKVEEDEDGRSIVASLLIDGKPLEELAQYQVDMFVIQESLSTMGALGGDVFTCGCGVAECAGIYKRMLIITNESTVQWFVRWPTYRQYIFDKEQYNDAFNRFRNQLIKDAGGLDKVDSLEYFIGLETKTLFDDFIPNPLSSEYCIELHEAVEYEDFDAVKILLDNNYIDVDHLNTQGETPLMLATSQEMENLLLSYGADATRKISL